MREQHISTLKTNMASLDFRLKKHETRNYLLEEIKQNELMSEKHKKSMQRFKLLWTFF